MDAAVPTHTSYEDYLTLEETSEKCTGFGSEAMLFIESENISTYAEATFVCGEVEKKNAIKNGVSLGV